MAAAGDQAFPAELLRFAKELPPPILESVCRRLEALPSAASADDRAQVAVAVSNPEMRHVD